MLEIETNIDELIEKFEKLQSDIGAVDFSDALIVGVNAGMGAMSNRIFNEGKDVDGLNFGKYTGKKKGISKKSAAKFGKLKILGDTDLTQGLSDYEKTRLKRGRQIGYKDLEFTGDLRRGIVIGVESKTLVICWIPNDELFLIAKYQEEQIGAIQGGDEINIFSFSKEEKEIARENVVAALKQLYDRLFTNK